MLVNIGFKGLNKTDLVFGFLNKYTMYSEYTVCDIQCILIHSDEGLTLETSAFNLFMVANLPYQLS